MRRLPRLSRCAEVIWQSITTMPAARQASTSRASATFDASVSRLNIDSPKNTRAQPHPIEAADQLPPAPGLDAVGVAAPVELDVGLHHFRRDPGAEALRARGAAQASITPAKSRSITLSKPPLRSVFARLREQRNSSGKSTARGSGDHQSTGWPGEYQGKIPRRYAASSRSVEQVAAGSEQAGRLVQRLLQRRKPLRRVLRREPGDRLHERYRSRFAGRARARESHPHTLRRQGLRASRKSSTAARKRRSAMKCADQVSVGSKPRAHLVLALRAGLEAAEAVLDAVFDALVIARFEMQAVLIHGGAPVAAVERIGLRKKMAHAIGSPPWLAIFTISAFAHRAAHLGEELAREIGLVAVAQERVAMEGVDAIEQAACRGRSRAACRR